MALKSLGTCCIRPECVIKHDFPSNSYSHKHFSAQPIKERQIQTQNFQVNLVVIFHKLLCIIDREVVYICRALCSGKRVQTTRPEGISNYLNNNCRKRVRYQFDFEHQHYKENSWALSFFIFLFILLVITGRQFSICSQFAL